MEDVQSQPDLREVDIDRVGISGLRYPVAIRLHDGSRLQTVGVATLSVGLPRHVRGTHMSRMVELLHDWSSDVSCGSVAELAERLCDRLDAPTAFVEIQFSLFVDKRAPVSGLEAKAHYESRFAAMASRGLREARLGVRVPVTSVCPCSKAISDYGAHNQRGWIDIEVSIDPGALIGHGELISIAENAASAPVFPLVKRSDERHLTMAAFDNPVFVEDMVRDVSVRLREDPRVRAFRVRVETDESIHDHGAFAEVTA